MNSFNNVIFDLDGTLIDTQIDIKESFQKAVKNIKGLKIDFTTIEIGPPLEEMIRKSILTVSDEEVINIVTNFRAIYRKCGFQNTRCYKGIGSLLRKLKKKDKHIFVATNKPAILTRTIIDNLNIYYFDDIVTIDSIDDIVLSKTAMVSFLIEKHQLNKKLTFMVGDSWSDIYSARENAISSIGVGYGYGTKELKLKSNPDFYFDSVLQLTDFLNKY